MENWGYTVNKDNQIDFDKNSKEISQKVLELEPSFGFCMACGTCSGTCSAANFTQLSLRRINVLISRGETDKLFKEISKCMLCGKCSLLCPRGVNTRNLILSIKKVFDDYRLTN